MKNGILNRFNEEVTQRLVRLHGAALISGGKVIEEIYNGNYTRDTKTRMYSTSKSVAAVAIGKLIGEGKLSLDDKIVDVFKDRFDMSDVHPLLKEQTVRHMLTMTTCYSKPTYDANTRDWLASYFRATPTHPAGTVWWYDSSGSYVLGAVVKHITGLDYIEYLRPEFDIMGISEGVCSMKGPDGEAWASSAFMATTTDLGKIAYMLLSGGKWGDRQIIPEDYARDAISPLVRNDDSGTRSRFDVGYGYQIWGHPDGAFAFRGLGGQIAIGFPGRDLVFCCNSDNAGMHNAYDEIFNAVESIILPEFPITDMARYEAAQQKPVTVTVFDRIKNKTFALDENPMHIEAVRFTEDCDKIILHYTKDGIEREIPFGIGHEVDFIFPEKYTGDILFDEKRYINYKCVARGSWIQENKLYIQVFAEDIYVGNMTLAFAFREDGMLGVKADKCAQFFFSDFSGFATGRCPEIANL